MVRPLLLLLIANSCVLHAAETITPKQTLARAVKYLWSQQQADGSWRSEQYAVLRSGQALTPFILHALLENSDSLSSENAEKALQAVRFIIEHMDEEGALGRSDPDILEYPVYSTAYAILALHACQSHGQDLEADQKIKLGKMERYLKDAQFNNWSGFTFDMPAYGGWGFDKANQPGDPGHMDLAHTRRAMEAVSVARDLRYMRDSIYPGNTQRFLAVVQKCPETLAVQPVPEGIARPTEILFDGGFYFSPVVLAANKGRFDELENYWSSYATATCDGILALLAAGVPRDDDRVTYAVGWLREHTNLDYPQGVPTDYPEPWGEAIQFYHYSARAEVYRALDFPAEERAALAASVCKHQRTDGSFVNTVSPLMKEDEPLLATALAVVALTNCLP